MAGKVLSVMSGGWTILLAVLEVTAQVVSG